MFWLSLHRGRDQLITSTEFGYKSVIFGFFFLNYLSGFFHRLYSTLFNFICFTLFYFISFFFFFFLGGGGGGGGWGGGGALHIKKNMPMQIY